VVVQDLRGMRTPEPTGRDGLEGAVQTGRWCQAQPGAAVQQVGLVALDGEQVGRVLARHEEFCGGVVALERVGGDHRPGAAARLVGPTRARVRRMVVPVGTTQ
jgi:hypothetical protein